jgi:hypothetical protein
VILKLLNEILRIEEQARENHGWTRPVVGQLRKLGIGIVFAHGKRDTVEHLMADLKRRLRPYRGFPTVSHIAITGRPKISFFVTNKKIELSETGALNGLFSLADQGLLDRVRQCQKCNRWFFARFDHQRSCSEKCRIKYFRSSEKWKEHRRKKMKEYYRLHKDTNVVTKGGK